MVGFHLLLFCLFVFVEAGLDPIQQQALTVFYESLTNPGSLVWNTTAEYCAQEGITCDNSDPQNIIQLSLYNKGLAGTLSTQLGALTKLETLVLGTNIFGGTIPTELAQLVNLKSLVLDYNALEGPIPSQFTSLTSLTSLILTSNNLDGELQGALFLLPKLLTIKLNVNHFIGSLPDELTEALQLETLVLNANQLSGKVAEQVLRLPNLRALYLASNNFECPVADYSFIDENDFASVAEFCDTSSPESGPKTWIAIVVSLMVVIGLVVGSIVSITLYRIHKQGNYQELP